MPITKSEDVRLNDRLVALINREDKNRYKAMCDSIGENPSDHLRNVIMTEVKMWEEGKLEKD